MPSRSAISRARSSFEEPKPLRRRRRQVREGTTRLLGHPPRVGLQILGDTLDVRLELLQQHAHPARNMLNRPSGRTAKGGP
jgi:hypothetical protein